jgi:hypothetical protein
VRRKTTIYVEDDLLRATKIAAARAGKRDYQVVEEALRAYLGLELLERVGAPSKLTEGEALDLAYQGCIKAGDPKVYRAVLDPGVLVSGLISARGAPPACCCYGSKARSNSLLVEHCSPSRNAFSCAQNSDRT